MSDSFDNSWQKRWSGLADRLELALENNAYRFGLCLATVALVVLYVGAVTRLAQPPRWNENRFVTIRESSETEKFDLLQVDTVNRALLRLDRLADVLALKPHRLVLSPSAAQARQLYAIETHVLRLWLDEARGFASEGIFDLTSESIARAIVAITFQNAEVLADLPDENSNWSTHVKSMRETCEDDVRQDWRGLCAVLKSLRDARAKEDPPNPLSLAGWTTSQMVAESHLLSTTERLAYVRELVRLSADPDLLKYGRLHEWPKEVRDYAPVVRAIVAKLAPARAFQINFRPSKPLHVITSCDVPRLAKLIKDLEGVEARDVVWARVCDETRGARSTSPATRFAEAKSAQEFAEKNPNVTFAQIGVAEIKTALKHGWLDSQIDIASFLVESREPNSRIVATQVRSQSEEWNAKAQAYRVKAPVEILKLVRLRTI